MRAMSSVRRWVHCWASATSERSRSGRSCGRDVQQARQQGIEGAGRVACFAQAVGGKQQDRARLERNRGGGGSGLLGESGKTEWQKDGEGDFLGPLLAEEYGWEVAAVEDAYLVAVVVVFEQEGGGEEFGVVAGSSGAGDVAVEVGGQFGEVRGVVGTAAETAQDVVDDAQGIQSFPADVAEKDPGGVVGSGDVVEVAADAGVGGRREVQAREPEVADVCGRVPEHSSLQGGRAG